MPGCDLEREVDGSTALYRIAGRFENSCAWDLASRLAREPLRQVVIDFSRADGFVDSAVAVIASSLLSSPHRVQLRGLRHHQERLFKYFGVDSRDSSGEPEHLPPELSPSGAIEEVA
jgi:hypothetical protein